MFKMANFFADPRFADVRRTDEEPPQLSIYDLVGSVTGQTACAARRTFLRIIKNFPEIESLYRLFMFDGRATPVTNAKGAVMIINALPGKVATKLRLEWADVIVRYLGGDLTLVQEIAHNRDHPGQHP